MQILHITPQVNKVKQHQKKNIRYMYKITYI